MRGLAVAHGREHVGEAGRVQDVADASGLGVFVHVAADDVGLTPVRELLLGQPFHARRQSGSGDRYALIVRARPRRGTVRG
jgi:hypothetical protein